MGIQRCTCVWTNERPYRRLIADPDCPAYALHVATDCMQRDPDSPS